MARLPAAVLISVLVVVAAQPQGCEGSGSLGGRGCVTKHELRRAAVVLDDEPPAEARPKPKPKPKKERVKPDCTKANAKFWKSLRPWRGKYKTDGKQIYYWDYTHNDLEVYSLKTGKHLGSAHPDTGEMIKGPVKGRRLEEK
ncbi:colicin E3/pyocin S6 family cytotoxin [Carbonactinospora thermoautotrophica]|uniref:colicin E3/pyocin S6 family cytotoxin n=1 Tax=Carbonactinospora thermoautotrophica TaxID=1469144 RepID=UPI002272200A|nr:colicin E3/pyocin S6 family cytotoxin [Carbonactinospora thermoautotrophica]